MKLKNNIHKIISVGETTILPGETKEVQGFDDNPVVAALVKRKDLSVVKEKTTGRK